MASQRKTKRGQSYIAGEKGSNRVRLYMHPRGGTLVVDYRLENGRRKREALRHTDFERGKTTADTLAAELRIAEGPRSSVATLKALFDNYEREMTPTKSVGKQAHDRSAAKLFVRCWGVTAKVPELDRRDWERFIKQRRSGELRPEGDCRKAVGVRDRVVEYDLRFLLAVCNWAETVRVNGKPMLERNPFKGFPIPTEANPDRPITTQAEFLSLQEAARGLGKDVELFLLLVQETGHRCTAVARLKWTDISDLDTVQASIRWRPEHDKISLDHTVPISEQAAEALREARLRAAKNWEGKQWDGWIFPSPTDSEQPIRRDLLRDWWQRLEKAAGLPRVQRRGWHSLRRKFATDMKDTPLVDLCRLGGWKNPQTVLRCYMKPDEVTMRSALVKRAERLAVAVGS